MNAEELHKKDRKIGLEFPLMRMALVVSDDDSSAPAPIIVKHGNVQVQILPELADIDGSKCPWAMPWSASKSGIKQDVGDHVPPEKGSLVWVRVEDVYFREVYYLDAAPFATDFYPYKNMASKITVDGSYSPTYPQPRFKALPEGSIVFWDTNSGDMGLQHKTGAYVYIDKTGQATVQFLKKLTMKDKDGNTQLVFDSTGKTATITADEIDLQATTVKIKNGGDSVSLFTPLSKILNKLLTHIHVAPTGPTQPAVDSSMSPLSSLQGDVNKIKSTVTESD
jgi:hypothetical protein